MKKIPTLFVRDMNTKLVTPVVAKGCEWVTEGVGVGTRKFDGTACLIRGGVLYKRREVRQATATYNPHVVPEGFIFEEFDPNTQKAFGWVPVGDGKEDRYHREAFEAAKSYAPHAPDGTYELCGPRIQNNPERCSSHVLLAHGKHFLDDCPRDFDGLKAYLTGKDIEGVVFWRDPGDPTCEKSKIKVRDFGLKRGAK